MVDLWRDFWIRETGTGQQVAQLHDIYDDDGDNDDDDDDLAVFVYCRRRWEVGAFMNPRVL